MAISFSLSFGYFRHIFIVKVFALLSLLSVFFFMEEGVKNVNMILLSVTSDLIKLVHPKWTN